MTVNSSTTTASIYKTIYSDNTQYSTHKLFPFPIRNSSQSRILTHSLYFTSVAGLSSLAYHGLKLDILYASKMAMKTVIHKSLLSVTYFCNYCSQDQYFYEIMSSWMKIRTQNLKYQKIQLQKQPSQQLRVSNWSVSVLTSVFIMPIILVSTHIFAKKINNRRKIMRSIADGLCLAVFSNQFQRDIDKRRNKILKKQIKQEQIVNQSK